MSRSVLALLGALAAFAVGAPATAAAAPAPFGHPCTSQNGVRFCPTTGLADRVPTWDGVPLDVDVTLPATGDGPFPTIVMLHGYGGDKSDFEQNSPEGDSSTSATLYHWNNTYFAQQGYAVVNYSARGFGRSCGQVSSRTPDCRRGWIHLADQRYEARDTQTLLGELADEGLTQPTSIGVTGISYGGGQSLELAYLRDRIRRPDGSFAPWTSPNGTPMSIAAAYPRWLWSDLVNSLVPNGRFLDTRPPGADDSRDPIGVPKQSYIEGLFASGHASGYYCGDPPGPIPCDEPGADVTGWHTRVLAGEPYTDDARAIIDEIYSYHQGFGLPGTPAPLLLQDGFTDDLFPVTESLRVYNALRASDPAAPVTLQFGDLGHARGTNKPAVDRYFNDQGAAFLAAHLKGSGTPPAPGSVTAFPQTCPASAPAGDPITAPSWTAIHPGAIRFSSRSTQLVSSTGGNPATAAAYDPVAGGGDSCRQVADETAPGTAVYRGPKSAGYTMVGLPTVTARVATTGSFGQLDARLWDVGPDGRQTLVTRGTYRLPDDFRGTVAFELFGNAYRFEPKHRPKLELLGSDGPFLRPSNGAFTVQVSEAGVTLPTAAAGA